MKSLVIAVLLLLSHTGFGQVTIKYQRGHSIQETCDKVGETHATEYDSVGVFILSNDQEQIMRIYFSEDGESSYYDMPLYSVRKVSSIDTYDIKSFGPDGQETVCRIYGNSNSFKITDNSEACAYLYFGNVKIYKLTIALLNIESQKN